MNIAATPGLVDICYPGVHCLPALDKIGEGPVEIIELEEMGCIYLRERCVWPLLVDARIIDHGWNAARSLFSLIVDDIMEVGKDQFHF